MAEARITEFFGETQIREEVLDFMGLGSCMPREAWRLPSPQMVQGQTATTSTGSTGEGRESQSKATTTTTQEKG